MISLATVHKTVRFIPLSLLYIKAYLVERCGYPFEAVDIDEFPLDADPASIAERILAREPAVVGLSCYVWNIRTLAEAARRVKAARPGVKIVLGGPEVGPIARSVMEANPAVDVIVKSEGEIPFSELIAAWQAGTDIAAVDGIAYRRDGAILETRPAAQLMDLNQIPTPHVERYAVEPGRYICIETQRGCVFRCNFCFYNKGLSIRNRRFDLDRVKADILFWLGRGVTRIYLMDPVFNLYAERAKEICRFIAEHNRNGVDFQAEIWAEFIDAEMARLMREANFTFLEVGLQTTDSTALATVERRLKMEKFIHGIRCLRAEQIPYQLQLIYGLPGETTASFRDSLDFAVSLDPPELRVFPLMVLPGTELWNKAQELGISYDPDPPYLVRSHATMNAADIAAGPAIVDAMHTIGDAKTFRILSREPGLRFSEILEQWLAMEPAEVPPERRRERVLAFVERLCGERKIAVDFYRRVAEREFAPATAGIAAGA